MKILCVDDDAITRLWISTLLEKYTTIEVIEASNGVDAIKILHHRKDIDVVILDYDMPEMNGMDVIKQTYHHMENVNSKFFFHSCHNQIHISDLLELENIPPGYVSGFLQKPANEMALFSILNVSGNI